MISDFVQRKTMFQICYGIYAYKIYRYKNCTNSESPVTIEHEFADC